MKQSTKNVLLDLLDRYPMLCSIKNELIEACEVMITCWQGGHKLLVCGNGGSAADALHIVGELMKGFALPRKLSPDEAIYPKYVNEGLQGALPAISLVCETGLMTAYANDVSADLVFAQQVHGYGSEGDVLFVLSTSGNSPNIIYAVEVAKARNLKTISLTGKSGGKLRSLTDILISVPETVTYKIQELHLPIYHTLCLAVENEFFG